MKNKKDNLQYMKYDMNTIIKHMHKDFGDSGELNNFIDIKSYLIKALQKRHPNKESLEEERLSLNAVINKREAVGAHAIGSSLIYSALFSLILVFFNIGEIKLDVVAINLALTGGVFGAVYFVGMINDGLELSYLKLKLECIENLIIID